MIMKTVFFLIPLLLIVACDSDDGPDPIEPDISFQLEYIDQDIQGKINGRDIVLKTGSANNNPPPEFESLFLHRIFLFDSLIEKDNCFTQNDTTSRAIISYRMMAPDSLIPERKIYMNEKYIVNNYLYEYPYFIVMPDGNSDFINGIDMILFDTGYVETKFLNNNYDSLEIKCVVGLERDLANNHIIGKIRLRYCDVL